MMTLSSLSSSNVRILAEIPEDLIPVTSYGPPGWRVSINQIGLLRVYVTDGADVDTSEEKYSEKDIIYPIINYTGLYLDNKYLLMDIYYPFSN